MWKGLSQEDDSSLAPQWSVFCSLPLGRVHAESLLMSAVTLLWLRSHREAPRLFLNGRVNKHRRSLSSLRVWSPGHWSHLLLLWNPTCRDSMAPGLLPATRGLHTDKERAWLERFSAGCGFDKSRPSRPSFCWLVSDRLHLNPSSHEIANLFRQPWTKNLPLSSGRQWYT
jgi:hypothetical protein